MPANKYAAIRYRVIHNCLSKRFPDYPTKGDLIAACEEALGFDQGGISASTIEKDLWAMKNETTMMGICAPIKYSTTHRGYYYTDPGYTLTNMPLTDVDMEAIYFASSILSQFQGMKMFEQFSDAIDKISDAVNLTRTLDDDLDSSGIIKFDKAPYFKGDHLLNDLALTIKNKKVINLLHKGFESDAAYNHTVHPYLLKEFRKRWYVVGWSDAMNAIRTYGLDRIEEMRVIDGIEFRESQGFSAEAFFKYVYGISQPDGKFAKVQLSFTRTQSKYIATQPLHHSQTLVKEVGSGDSRRVIYSYEVVPNYEFKMQLLSYADQVKVLKPKSLADDIQRMIGSMAAVYKKSSR